MPRRARVSALGASPLSLQSKRILFAPMRLNVRFFVNSNTTTLRN